MELEGILNFEQCTTLVVLYITLCATMTLCSHDERTENKCSKKYLKNGGIMKGEFAGQ